MCSSPIRGNWTPVVSCDNPTDLLITFSEDPIRNNGYHGDWARIGPLVFVTYRVNFGISYTDNTGGRLKVEGLPFSASTAPNSQTLGTLTFQCFSAVHQQSGLRYTQFGSLLFPGDRALKFFMAGEGVPEAGVFINHINNNQPIVLLEGGHWYFTDEP